MGCFGYDGKEGRWDGMGKTRYPLYISKLYDMKYESI
jgi:hypothetical protein